VRLSDGEAAKRAVLIEDQGRSVPGPVGRFEVGGGNVLHMAVGGGDGDGFKSAHQHLLALRRLKLLEADMRERGFLDGVFVVRADADADIKRAGEYDAG